MSAALKKVEAPAVMPAPKHGSFISHESNPENGEYAEFYNHLEKSGELEKAKKSGVEYYKNGALFHHPV